MSGLEDGARNLLFGCGGFARGERLLIVHEDPSLGWYDAAAPQAVAALAAREGIDVTLCRTATVEAGADPHADALIAAHDNVVFFARLGDRNRFAAPGRGRTVMCYATTAAALASPFGTTPHAAMVDLKRAVDAALFAADEITLACPLGTKVCGRAPGALDTAAEVGVRRFPLGVPTPMPAEGFSGTVVLARYLTPTGSRVYEPAVLPLASPVLAEIAAARITALSGAEDVVGAVSAHYHALAARFGIDPGVVHSFHAGIHAGCHADRPAADNADRWSNTVFSSPRALHFHTCGAYAPGEICWMVTDPTITLDGCALWQDGRFVPQAHPQTAAALARHPALGDLFAAPPGPLGI